MHEQYVKIVWKHNNSTEPNEFYFELDKDGFDIKRIELFENGNVNYFDQSKGITKDCSPMEEAFPGVNTYNRLNSVFQDPKEEFLWAYSIPAEAFNKAWKRYIEQTTKD